MASQTPKSVSLTFEPGSQDVEIEQGETILHAAWQCGVAIKSVCGGRGKCGTCLVELPQPDEAATALSPQSAQETSLLPRSQAGTHRLACMTHVHGPAVIFVPPESRAAATPPSKPYNDTRVALAPTVERVTIDIASADPNRSARWQHVSQKRLPMRPGGRLQPSYLRSSPSIHDTAASTPQRV